MNKEAGKMPRKRYTPEEIIHKLREAEVLLSQEQTVQQAARQLGISEQTRLRRSLAQGVRRDGQKPGPPSEGPGT
jgi:transposase-like protein